jgi:hypothetical protein
MFPVVIRIASILRPCKFVAFSPDIHPDLESVTQNLILKNIGNKFPAINTVFV